MTEEYKEDVQLGEKKATGIRSKIVRIIWDNDDKTVEERRFVRKLDSILLTIVSGRTSNQIDLKTPAY